MGEAYGTCAGDTHGASAVKLEGKRPLGRPGHKWGG
jgi:hypothetical protein